MDKWRNEGTKMIVGWASSDWELVSLLLMIAPYTFPTPTLQPAYTYSALAPAAPTLLLCTVRLATVW